MNKITVFFAFLLLCSCSNDPQPAVQTIDWSQYPEALQKVFAKHGSLEAWQKMKALSYEIVKPEKNEKHFIHLKDRREKIEGANFITGYNGKDIWVEADTTYKGNPVFYHNLMFYFYAMPFVVADDGIIYSKTNPFDFEGKSYPGIRIAYEDDVGYSSEDEYFIHYDPTTYQMTWLGYTVTYFSKEKSKEVKWIRYDDWKTFNGLLLPNSISWYKMEEGKVTTPRNTVTFANVKVSPTPFEDQLFEKTAGAVTAE